MNNSSKNMKIVLINPPGNFEMTLGRAKGMASTLPPLSLAYLAAHLKRYGHDIEVIDAYLYNMDVRSIVEIVVSKTPDLVGISVLTPSAKVSHVIAGEIKKNNPKIKIVFGGVHPTVLTDSTLEDSSVDFVVRGEGEITLKELAEAIEKGRGIESVKGLSYVKDDKILHNRPRDFVKNIDELGAPDWSFFPSLEKYKPLPHWNIKIPSIPMLSSRGCPFRCTFCCVKVSGGIYRTRTAKSVCDEIEDAIDKYGIKQVSFFDPAFPMNKEVAKEVCREIIKRGLNKKIIWMTESRIDCVDEELLKLMKKSGCRRLALGIESGNQKILNSINKNITLDQVRETVHFTRKVGMEIIAYFIIGFPEDSKQTINETIEFAKEIDADYVKFNIAVPYPGTELYDYALKEERLLTKDWDKYTSFSSMTDYDPVFVPKYLNIDELNRLQRKAFRSYYFRPKMLFKHILKMRSPTIIKEYVKNFFYMLKSLKGET